MSQSTFPGAEFQFEGHTLLDIALGKVRGLSLLNGTAFGVVSAVSFQTLWGFGATSVSHADVPETVDIVSTDLNDTAAGTGARAVRIIYIATEDAMEFSAEDILLNGLTPVTSVQSVYRVLSVAVISAGSSEANVGDISVTGTVSGSNVVKAEAGVGIDQTGVYAVPKGFKLFVHGAMVTAVDPGKSLRLRLKSHPFGGPHRVIYQYDNVMERAYVPILRTIGGQTDIEVEVKTTGGGPYDVTVDPVAVLVDIAEFSSGTSQRN